MHQPPSTQDVANYYSLLRNLTFEDSEMKPQSGLTIRYVLLKAPSIPAGPASSSKVAYLLQTPLASVPSGSCVSRREPGNEIGFLTLGSWDGCRCSALLCPRSDLPDSRAAGASRLGHRVAVGNQRDGSRQLETQPPPPIPSPVSHASVHSETRAGHTPSVCSTMSTVTSLWKWLHFLTKNMEQKVRTQDRKMHPCSQSRLGWCNTELLSHQAGESDPCFWLDHVSIWAHRCLPYCSPGNVENSPGKQRAQGPNVSRGHLIKCQFLLCPDTDSTI